MGSYNLGKRPGSFFFSFRFATERTRSAAGKSSRCPVFVCCAAALRNACAADRIIAMSLFNFSGGGDIWSSAGFAFVR